MTRQPQRPRYELRNGQYCLFDLAEPPAPGRAERHCHLRTDLVALAYDPITGKVLRHGDPRTVQAWAWTRRHQLRADGLGHQANRVWVVSGPLPVDDINRCLDTPGYLLRLMQRLPQVPHGKLGIRPSAAAGASASAADKAAKAATAAKTATDARAAERERQRARMRDLHARQEQARADARERARQKVRDDLRAQSAAWASASRPAAASASVNRTTASTSTASAPFASGAWSTASAHAAPSAGSSARPRTGCYGFVFPSCPSYA